MVLDDEGVITALAGMAFELAARVPRDVHSRGIDGNAVGLVPDGSAELAHPPLSLTPSDWGRDGKPQRQDQEGGDDLDAGGYRPHHC